MYINRSMLTLPQSLCHKWCLRKRRTHKGFKFKYSCQLERSNWKKNTVSFRNSDMVIHLSLSTTFRAMNNFQTHSFELFAARSSVSLYSTCSVKKSLLLSNNCYGLLLTTLPTWLYLTPCDFFVKIPVEKMHKRSMGCFSGLGQPPRKLILAQNKH